MATIDERVVEMRFDNKDFEKNVQTSLKTIDKLKDSLDFEDATKSLDDLQDAARHFTLDDIGNALENLSEKFSWENVFKVDLLRRTLDLVEGEIKRAFSVINQALMLDQVDWVNNMRLGWDKYAEKTQSVATIMAATGASMETVNEQMEKLMFFTDETSYNFTDMAGNIGKFTANGVSLEKSVSAMEGIANWAARSGQETEAASRVMYNLSQAIGMGALKLQDWKSVELANMGTKEFKEVAIAAGLAEGTLIQVGNTIVTAAKKAEVTTNNFRETLKEGWLDSNTLIRTLNEYGKASELISEINAYTGMWTMDMWDIIEGFRGGSYNLTTFLSDLEAADVDVSTLDISVTELYQAFEKLASKEYEFSLEAYKAGQEARTFGQAMKSVADAVSSGWMKTFELIFGQYEEAKELWSDLAENLFDIFRTGSDRRNQRLTEASIDGWEALTSNIQNAGVSLDDFEKALIKASHLSEQSLIHLADNYDSFSDVLLSGVLGTENSIEIVKEAIDSLEGSGTSIESANRAIGLSYEEIDKYGQDIRAGVYGWYTSEEQVQRLMAANSDLTKEQAEMIVKYAEASHELHRSLTEEEYKEWLGLQDIIESQGEITELTDEQKEAYKRLAEQMYRQNARKAFLQGLINSGHIAVDVVNLVRDAIENIFPPTSAEQLSNIATKFQEVTEKVRGFFEDTELDEEGNKVLKNADKIKTIQNAIALLLTPLRIVTDLIAGIGRLIVPLGKLALTLLSPVFALFGAIGNALASYREATGELEPFANLISKVSEAISVLLGYITEVAKYVGDFVRQKFIEKFSGPLSNLLTLFGEFKSGKLKGLDDFIASIKDRSISEAGDKIIGKLRTLWGTLRNIKNGAFFAPMFDFFSKVPKKVENFKKQVDKLAKEKGIGKIQASFIVFNQKVTEKLEGLYTKLKEFSFKDFAENLKENFKLTTVGQSISKFKKQINDLAETKGMTRLQAAATLLKDKMSNAFQELKDNIKAKLSNLGLEKVANWISTVKNNIIAKFKEVKAAVEAYLAEHGIDFSAMFTNFKTSVKNKLNDLGLGFIWTYLVSIKTKIKETVDAIKQILEDFLAGNEINFEKIFGKKEATDEEGGILAFFNGVKEKILAKLEEIKKAVEDFFANYGIDFSKMFNKKEGSEEGTFFAFLKDLDILKVLKGGAIAAGVAGLVKLLFGFSEAAEVAEEISSGHGLEGVVDALNPFGEQFERVKQAVSGFNIVTFALGLLILAGALSVIGNLPVESVALALGTAGAALAEFIGTIAALNSIMGEKKIINFVGLGLGMMAIAGSLYIFAKAVEAFKEIDFASGSQALKTIGLILLAIVALKSVAKVAGNFKFGVSGGLGLIAAAGAMYIFGKALESYTKLDIHRDNILKVLGTLLLAIVTFGAISAIAGYFKFKLGTGLGMIAMAASLLIFAGIVAILGKMSDAVLAKGLKNLTLLAVIVTVMTMLIGVINSTAKFGSGIRTVLTLVGIVGALTILSGVIIVLGAIPDKFLDSGIKVLKRLGVFLLIMSALMTVISSFTNVKKAFGMLIILGGLVLTLTVLSGLVIVLGALALVSLPGIVAVGLLMVGLYAIIKALAELGKTVSIKETFAMLGALVLFTVTLIGLVYVIKELEAVDAQAAMDGLVILGALLFGFAAILAMAVGVGLIAQAAAPLFFVGIAVVAVLFAGFILAIHQAITELERLSQLDTPGIMAAIDAIDALIDEFCGIANKFNENGMTFETAITTAAKMFAFGIGLHPLITDAQLLQLVNAEAVVPGIEAVDALLDYMISLRDKFLESGTNFGNALLTAGTVFAFGAGLYPLANDVQILGLSNATAAKAAIEPMNDLITMMISLATVIGIDPSLFRDALTTAGVVGAFGIGLLPLCAAELVTGFADAETVKSNMGVISGLIDQFFSIAEKVGSDPSLYEAAETVTTAIKGFAGALALIVGAEFLAQFVNATDASAGFQPVKDIIDFFIETATKFTTGEVSFEDAQGLATACKGFAGALALLIGAEFVAQFVNPTEASTGFQPIKDLIDFFIEIAQKLDGKDGNIDFTTAQGTASACVEFGKALALLAIGELISAQADAENAKASLEVIKGIVGMFMLIAYSFNKNEGMFTSAKEAAVACGEFAAAVVDLAKGEKKIAKVDAEDALAGLEAVRTTVDIFTSMARAFARTEGMKQAATDAADTIGVFATKLKTLARSLSNSLAEDTWANVNGEKVVSVANAIIDFMTKMSGLTGLGDIASAVTSINEFFAGIASLKTNGGAFSKDKFDVSDAVTAIDNISTSITGLTSSIAKLDSSNLDTFVSLVTSFTNSESALTVLSSFRTFGSDMMTNISDGASEGASIFSVSLGLTMSSTVDTIRNYYNSFYNAGRYLIVGFNNGLVSGANKVYANARIIANSVARIMRNTLQIKSPSRVFAEIGEYTMLGLAKGIEDTGIKPLEAVTTLGDNLIDAMHNAIMYANNADYGIMPTVTPVVDMAQMADQSAMFKSIMGNFDLQGMVANANIDGATINNSIQSKDIIAEIRQLNERLATMDENLQNMQLVLDTGALVGGTSVAMDNQFGKMAMRRGRGN